MRIGSLCSGYGGLDQAVQAVLGGDLAWVADPDPGATNILAHHHPDVPNLGDITTIDWTSVETVDILTAGFPCQDISNAGKRAGIEGERSGIWTNVVEAVRVLRPGLVFLENVSALTSRGLDRVAADLAEVGFVGSWRCVRASDVGAPHRRERIFILAWPADPAGPRLEGARVLGRAPERRGGPVADTDHAGGDRGGSPGREPQRHAEGSGAAAAHADRGRVRAMPHGEPAGPEVDHDHDRVNAPGRLLEWPAATHAKGDGRHEGRAQSAGIVGGSDAAVSSGPAWGSYAGAINRWERATGRHAPVPTEPGRTGQPRLSPAFVEWLMGLSAGHVTAPEIGLTRNQQLKALGNGVVPQQGAAALRILLERATADVAA